MKTIRFIFLIFFYGQWLTAQSCLPDGITFTSQADIDNFPVNYPNCTAIQGDVVIGSDFMPVNVFNLNGLSNIQSFGRLTIQNASLSSLNGLEQVTSITSLTIAGCPNFSTFDGLQNLLSLDSLFILYNPFLYYLNGLPPNITALKTLVITSPVMASLVELQQVNSLENLVLSMPKLNNFNGLQHITSIDSLAVSNLPLTDLTGLSQISPIRSLSISDCPNLIDLGGIQHLTALNSLSISSPVITNLNDLHNIVSLKNLALSLPALSGFSGLENITALDSLALSNIPLTNLNGWSQLTALGSLTVSDCGQLTSLSGLDNISALPGSLTITADSLLPNLAGLANVSLVGGSFEVSYCPQLSSLGNFGATMALSGTLTISNNNLLANLNGLESLTTIGQRLWINMNPQLVNLDGLNNLQSVAGWIYLADNAGLTTIQALANLKWVGSNLYVEGNTALTSLTGLNGISVIPGDLYIVSDDALANLSGLDNLDSVYNYVFIQSNNNLTSLAGLGQLRYVGKYLNIYGHPSLPNLTGLDQLEFANYLDIIGNPGLQHLKGLEHLKSVKEDIYITSNPALVDVDGLSGLESVGGSLNIYNSEGLKSLNGLNNLTSIGKDLVVAGDLELADISSLQSLSAIGGNLNVSYNPRLANCVVLGVCNQIAVAPDRVQISNNGLGCNSVDEAASECKGSPVVVRVLLDNNGDQLPFDPTDSPIEHIRVSFSEPGQLLLRPTDAGGSVRFGALDTQDFSLQVPEAPGDVWGISQLQQVFISGTGKDSIHVDLILTPKVSCPQPTVTLGLPPNFRGCLVQSDMQVSTQNTGAVLAEGVTCAVVLPHELEWVEAVPAPSATSGDTLFFEYGHLKPFETATVHLTVKTRCDVFLFGRTLCVEAFAAVDNPCPVTPLASSEIKLAAQCIGDTLVRFTLKNIGDAPTLGPHAYRLIRDGIAFDPVDFSLGAQQSQAVDILADGATWRMEATKFEDGTQTAVALENCYGLTPGQITAFWLEKGPPAYDFDCREALVAYDPNLKTAIPGGVGPDHTLEANVPLQYTIGFQNTGADTAFRVVLRDVLPVGLDIVSFRPVAASHPYTWQIRDSSSLEVFFFPIALPDSTANEPASHGFFSFEIAQQPGLPDGSVLENTANIVFDFNPPITTNTVLHRIGQLTVQIDEPQQNAGMWVILGNPTRDATTFRAKAFIPGEKQFELYDAAGHLVQRVQFADQAFEFRRGMLSGGVYVFRISGANGNVFTGKIVIAEN